MSTRSASDEHPMEAMGKSLFSREMEVSYEQKLKQAASVFEQYAENHSFAINQVSNYLSSETKLKQAALNRLQGR